MNPLKPATQAKIPASRLRSRLRSRLFVSPSHGKPLCLSCTLIAGKPGSLRRFLYTREVPKSVSTTRRRSLFPRELHTGPHARKNPGFPAMASQDQGDTILAIAGMPQKIPANSRDFPAKKAVSRLTRPSCPLDLEVADAPGQVVTSVAAGACASAPRVLRCLASRNGTPCRACPPRYGPMLVGPRRTPQPLDHLPVPGTRQDIPHSTSGHPRRGQLLHDRHLPG